MEADDLRHAEDQLHAGQLQAAQQAARKVVATTKGNKERLGRAYSVLIQSDFQSNRLTDLQAVLGESNQQLEGLPAAVILLWGVVAVELQEPAAARAVLSRYLAAAARTGLGREDAMALSRLYAVQLLSGLCGDFEAAADWLAAGGAGLSPEQQELLLLEVDEAEELHREERLAQWAAAAAVAAEAPAGVTEAAAAAAAAASGAAAASCDTAADRGSASISFGFSAMVSASAGAAATDEAAEADTACSSAGWGPGTSDAAAMSGCPSQDLGRSSRFTSQDDTPWQHQHQQHPLGVDAAVPETTAKAAGAPGPAAAAAAGAAAEAPAAEAQDVEDSPYCVMTGHLEEKDLCETVAVAAAGDGGAAAVGVTGAHGTSSSTSSTSTTSSGSSSSGGGGAGEWLSRCSGWITSKASSFWDTPIVQALHLQDVPPWELAGGAAVAVLVSYSLYRERRRLRRAAADLAVGVVQTAQMGLGFGAANAMGRRPTPPAIC